MLSSISKAVEIAKQLREVSEKIKDADTRGLIADLNLELADIKMQFAELQEEKLELQKQLRDARTSEDLRDKLEMKGGLYYLTEPVPGKQDGPYCTNCFENEGKLMPVRAMSSQFRFAGTYICPACNAKY